MISPLEIHAAIIYHNHLVPPTLVNYQLIWRDVGVCDGQLFSQVCTWVSVTDNHSHRSAHAMKSRDIQWRTQTASGEGEPLGEL